MDSPIVYDINYRSRPELFSNRVLMSIDAQRLACPPV
jgi:hypothetical protein